jgi:hypothetical protein
MKAIWKYPIKVAAEQSIEMPIGAEILCVQLQHDIPVLWAKVSPDGWPVKRTIVIHPTGHEFEEYRSRYIGTFQMEGGMYVWHVYEATP